ncbi:MAG: RNA polymerase sigma-70 factor [Flavobacterium sp.]|nr:MAG: RNA polymerase sigma-70 factor [Flavobacterium sp.]
MIVHKKISDQELLIRLKNGSHSGYTEIYNRYFSLMYAFAYRKLKDEDLAKDFFQELFVSLWNKRETLSETGKLSSYLCISIRSRILDYFTRQKVENKYIDFLKNYQLTKYEKTDHLLREKELADYIDKQIQSLPKKMRQVFELSRKENLGHTEIAEQLDITENNVSQHLSNALKIFRIKFGKMLTQIF